MADVFLSYAREDLDRARSVAGVLQARGWSVWWDRRLRGGTDFTAAIQQQLDEAHCIIVLWSKAGVVSQFVRDEAAEGLHNGRLVPALVDDCRPPLGFRQLHTIWLGDWLTTEAGEGLDRLIEAISAIVKPQLVSESPAPSPALTFEGVYKPDGTVPPDRAAAERVSVSKNEARVSAGVPALSPSPLDVEIPAASANRVAPSPSDDERLVPADHPWRRTFLRVAAAPTTALWLISVLVAAVAAGIIVIGKLTSSKPTESHNAAPIVQPAPHNATNPQTPVPTRTETELTQSSVSRSVSQSVNNPEVSRKPSDTTSAAADRTTKTNSGANPVGDQKSVLQRTDKPNNLLATATDSSKESEACFPSVSCEGENNACMELMDRLAEPLRKKNVMGLFASTPVTIILTKPVAFDASRQRQHFDLRLTTSDVTGTRGENGPLFFPEKDFDNLLSFLQSQTEPLEARRQPVQRSDPYAESIASQIIRFARCRVAQP